MISREDTLAVFIDFQEKLMPAMYHKEELENKVETDIGYLDGRPAYQVNEVVGRYCPECGWEE